MANRHKSRESAIEILYAWSSAKQDAAMIPSLLDDRIELKERHGQDAQYLRESIAGVTAQQQILDDAITRAMKGRSLRSVGYVEISVLRLAAWEMAERLEIPYRVIINEALQLTHTYADEPARAFVNGVLDRLAQDLRAEESRQAKAG